MGLRVFISHSSKDKPAVERLARALEARGIEVWLDKWEIGPGDDIVARINAGLDESGAGIIVFSERSRESRWVEAETSYLTYARIQEGKPLVPVKAEEGAWVPPLLRPLVHRGIEEHDAIADALLTRRGGPPPRRAEEGRGVERAIVTLRREGPAGVGVRVRIGREEHAALRFPALPGEVARGRDAFLRGFRAGIRRDQASAGRVALESTLADLGRALRELCLPGDAAEALADLVDGCKLGRTVEVWFEADAPELLGLPFEALRLKDDRLLATLPTVVVLRRPMGLPPAGHEPLAGPLKILVAVAAPDEGVATSVVLDQEREVQNILDATEAAQRHENAQVRILEVGHPEVIAAAVERDAYHVLHLSCHGMPGKLELEDEEGRAVPATAEDLLGPIRRTGRPLPLVFLSACHGGVEAGQTASFAEELLRAGVPCVLAMQTSVSDHHATQLARAFYDSLASREILLPSRALAGARKDLEGARLKAVQRGDPPAETQPEYATATLFVGGEDEPRLADFALDKEPLRERPVHEMAGPVPQLRVDDLIGRRRELRETLRALRDEKRARAGVVLTGIGGVGKSALTGRAMRRLAESGFLVAAHAGPWDLQGIAVAAGSALVRDGRPELRELGGTLARPDLDDRVRLQLLGALLAEEPIVLVLDDFERNLTEGGAAFRDADVAAYLGRLLRGARRGRLLLTCRYPVPGMEAHLRRISVGPLSLAESRKLLRRLDGLRGRSPSELAVVLRVIGGHPRMLEFLDALLHGGEGRLPHVTERLRRTMEEAGLDPDGPIVGLEEGIHQAIIAGARDVLLEELLDIARAERLDEVLLQVAVSNLPVSPAGVAHMLADGPARDVSPPERALKRLEELSLVHRYPDGSAWVHRWTAEGLARCANEEEHRERARRAGRYRWWRVQNESRSLEDAWEAVRNHLAGGDFDAATRIALGCFEALRRLNQSAGIAALAGEVLESLPPDHAGYGPVADDEGRAHLALGFTERAVERYEELLRVCEKRAQAEPDRADYQRDLSVSHERMGDLYRALGQGDKAREAYLNALHIRERLAQAEPDRADYQRDLSVSFNKVGDLYSALGQGDKAREAYLNALHIRERLAQAEPDRADYQVDLAVSLVRVALAGDEQARRLLERALSILNDLKRQGRLSPADEPKIALIESLLGGGSGRAAERQPPGKG
jgi:tetratricopeptide (TPR) repeat protein